MLGHVFKLFQVKVKQDEKIVVLNHGGWSDEDMETLKSLNVFIEEKKRDFSWISYRQQKERIVEIICEEAWAIFDRFQRFESKILGK